MKSYAVFVKIASMATSEPHDHVERGDELNFLGLVVVRARVGRPIDAQLRPDDDGAPGRVADAERRFEEVRPEARSSEHGRAGPVCVTEPLESSPELQLVVER